MILKNKNKLNLNKIASQICFLLGLSVGLVLFDGVPQYQQGKLTIDHQAWAQSPIDNDKLARYGEAAMEIEDLRKATYSNIRQIVGNSKSPPLACHQQENFRQLPKEARNMAMYYCKESERIVERHGLTNREFNEMTRKLKNNSQLRQKLREIMN